MNNGEFGIEESGATGPNNRYLHNIVSGNAEQGLDLATGTESGTISVDPLFVNYRPDGTGDYRLQPTSPGIDAGIPDGAPARTAHLGHPATAGWRHRRRPDAALMASARPSTTTVTPCQRSGSSASRPSSTTRTPGRSAADIRAYSTWSACNTAASTRRPGR